MSAMIAKPAIVAGTTSLISTRPGASGVQVSAPSELPSAPVRLSCAGWSAVGAGDQTRSAIW